MPRAAVGFVGSVMFGLGVTNAQPALTGTEVTIPLTVTTAGTERTYRLAAIEYRPAGAGPFPAVVLSHGSNNDPAERASITAEFPVAAEVFVGWGVVVLSPWRRSYGKSEGTWDEGYGGCGDPSPRFVDAGLESAKDIGAAARWLRARSYVDPERIALVGYSAGGWGSLALATQPAVPIRGVATFAGGRGGPGCAPTRVLAAFEELGKGVQVPTLWLFSSNDSVFPPDFARRMHHAFTAAGGTATLEILPPFRQQGHFFIDYEEAVPYWRDAMRAFLRRIGLLR